MQRTGWSEARVIKPRAQREITIDEYVKEIEARRSLQDKERGRLHDGGRAIATFARMKPTPEAKEAFRKRWTGYFPEEFWSWELPSAKALYGDTVFLGARPPEPPPFWVGFRDLLRAAWACGFEDSYVVRLLHLDDPEEESIHRA